MPATRRTKKSASTRKEPEAQLQNKRWVWTRPRDMVRLKKKRGKVSAAGSISQSMLQLGIGESISPNWDDQPEWTNKKLTRKWGKKCVERWCLLPPYDTRITEAQWKAYYEERTALEKINTMKSQESAAIVSEELMQNTWKILRKAAENVEFTILGCKLDDEQLKQRIARTLMGSLYFLELWGSNEEDLRPRTPRYVTAKTRLYSPFGIGTSIDLYYDYYYRYRVCMADERHSSLDGALRTISDCKPEDPSFCAAAPNPENMDEVMAANGCTIFMGVEDFFKGFVSRSIREKDLELFEALFFGCKGWISARKLVDLLLAAGEDFGRRRALLQERNLLAELEKNYDKEHRGEEVCVPQ
ncbi:hypothetical protein CTheo_7947 [Ceratobasidium theobromae]|uniref:Uncharacterized protein n=1 Tax=Ceratobasidium theobromae TaxID=1582974 RepID=A0A5N5QB38_9AGAM|nr:hypothetical protein CTheo_7947 [Ceratobasidium theobromae]